MSFRFAAIISLIWPIAAFTQEKQMTLADLQSVLAPERVELITLPHHVLPPNPAEYSVTSNEATSVMKIGKEYTNVLQSNRKIKEFVQGQGDRFQASFKIVSSRSSGDDAMDISLPEPKIEEKDGVLTLVIFARTRSNGQYQVNSSDSIRQAIESKIPTTVQDLDPMKLMKAQLDAALGRNTAQAPAASGMIVKEIESAGLTAESITTTTPAAEIAVTDSQSAASRAPAGLEQP